LAKKQVKGTEFFTPTLWGRFAVKQHQIVEKWLNGAIILDPTMGAGHLFRALIDEALILGCPLAKLPIANLYGIEQEKKNLDSWFNFLREYNLKLHKSNFICGDFCFTKPFIKADILLANPPWASFTNLNKDYAESLKPIYARYKLIESTNEMLWGTNRVDISALIMAIASQDWLKNKGIVAAFLPTSLFQSVSHKYFCKFHVSMQANLTSIYYFTNLKVFPINHSYLLAFFQKQKAVKLSTTPPIYYEFATDTQQWQEVSPPPTINFPLMAIHKRQQPRSGINTGGRNKLFIFNQAIFNKNTVILSNDHGIETKLPKKFVFPLMSSDNFKGATEARKWVFLPYERDARLITPDKLATKSLELVNEYLLKQEAALRSRTGQLLASYTRSPRYYTLLGVGPYSFTAYKVAWRTTGAAIFAPQIFSGEWQADQSMYAFIPADSLAEAKAILNYLSDAAVRHYVEYFAASTQRFAQPNIIKKLFKYHEHDNKSKNLELKLTI